VENLLVILVVEDDHLVQTVVEESLTEGGFEIVIASSGENAVQLLDTRKGKYRASPISILGQTRSTAGMSPDVPEKSTRTFPSFT
jgi:CheY-like chemotaxis protein